MVHWSLTVPPSESIQNNIFTIMQINVSTVESFPKSGMIFKMTLFISITEAFKVLCCCMSLGSVCVCVFVSGSCVCVWGGVQQRPLDV